MQGHSEQVGFGHGGNTGIQNGQGFFKSHSETLAASVLTGPLSSFPGYAVAESGKLKLNA